MLQSTITRITFTSFGGFINQLKTDFVMKGASKLRLILTSQSVTVTNLPGGWIDSNSSQVSGSVQNIKSHSPRTEDYIEFWFPTNPS